MIGFAPQDGARPIELFHEKDADELMGESHQRERNLLCGLLMEGGVEAIRTTDDEDDAAGAC